MKGVSGSQQDYGARIYDPRLGRFLSVDPISKEYPELTPYQFASNSPIENIDIDGLKGGSKTKGGAYLEGLKDGALLTLTGHASDAQDAPKFRWEDVKGGPGRFFTKLKEFESRLPFFPIPKFATMAEEGGNQGLEIGYKANKTGHSGIYITGLITEKVIEGVLIKRASGTAARWIEAPMRVEETAIAGINRQATAANNANTNAATSNSATRNSVFRGLSEADVKSVEAGEGITARNPGANNSAISHTAGKVLSRWISTTKDELIAKQRFGKFGFVEIDLNKVPADKVDVSKGYPSQSGMLSNWAKKQQEVLIEKHIPQDAIIKK